MTRKITSKGGKNAKLIYLLSHLKNVKWPTNNVDVQSKVDKSKTNIADQTKEDGWSAELTPRGQHSITRTWSSNLVCSKITSPSQLWKSWSEDSRRPYFCSCYSIVHTPGSRWWYTRPAIGPTLDHLGESQIGKTMREVMQCGVVKRSNVKYAWPSNSSWEGVYLAI